MSVTYAQICDAIAATLATITQLKKVQSYDELTEDYGDLPMAQVYPEASDTDSRSGATDRTSFRAGVRVTEAMFHVDVPCRQRSHVDEDTRALVEMAELVQAKLEAQHVKPYFGLEGIRSFRWRWERVNFERSGGVLYPGVRFIIWATVF